MDIPLKAPFPWFGGKSLAANLIWPRLGRVKNYIEPFAGSLAVLLARPAPEGLETVNDLDCLLVNFWRASVAAPAAVARHAAWPNSEADLVARNRYLATRDHLPMLLRMDPDFYDARLAGWWVWGLSCWIGSGFGASSQFGDGQPIVAGARAPLVKLPRANPVGVCSRRVTGDMQGYFEALRERLKAVRITCGDWRRVLTPANLTANAGPAGILLDPPYSAQGRAACYAEESFTVAQDVAAWAREHGADRNLRIALCGYEGEHAMPGWTCVAWTANGGYGNRSGNPNRFRERVWFSPGCLTA